MLVKFRISFNFLDSSTILTQVPLSAEEFEAYVVNCPTEVTFCHKELKVS